MLKKEGYLYLDYTVKLSNYLQIMIKVVLKFYVYRALLSLTPLSRNVFLSLYPYRTSISMSYRMRGQQRKAQPGGNFSLIGRTLYEKHIMTT